jgi:2'-5' RNA ligase
MTEPDAHVIVAIPSQDDYVWRLSSEKIPHLTLLFLGDQLENVRQVTDFIGHVTETSLSQFTLNVDHRGVLGDESADVLFFSDWGIDRLKDFRSYLLHDPNIRNAYNAAPQYDAWNPHLTLGYPTSPAKPDLRDYPGTYSVTFDRIALWTGDYEGVEFPLNKDMISHVDAGQSFLAHFGVKGMKWGVHRREGSSSSSPVEVRTHAKPGRLLKAKGGQHQPAHEDALRVAVSRQKARKSSTDALSNKELQDLVSRMNLERQYKQLLTTDPRAASDVSKLLNRALKVGKTVNDVNAFLNSPAGKTAKSAVSIAIKNAHK